MTEDVRQTYRDGPAAFDRFIADANIALDRASLRGPKDDGEAAELATYGWDPSVARRIAEDRAQQERDQAALLTNPPPLPPPYDRVQWRRERVRDIVRVRYFAFEAFEMLARGLRDRNLGLEDVWPDEDSARRVVDAMPSADAYVSLVTEYHRNPEFNWQPNDIFDIDALGVAMPYCDVVVADKKAADGLRRGEVPDRFGTTLCTSVTEVVDALIG